jgi:Zn-dependent M28 family amino/carboxypeptidase
MMADVQVLSADSMEGRIAASAGEVRATAYIAQRFEEIGLEPVDGSYLLPVELVGMRKNIEGSSISIRGPGGSLQLTNDENVTFWSTAEEETVELRNAPIWFVGYGVEAPEYDWDDIKGQDMSGRIMLFLNNDPQVEDDGEELFGGPARTYYGRWTYKFEQAQKHGAAGAIVIHTTESASYLFSVIGNTGSRQIWQRGYKLDFLSWIDSTTSETIAASMGTSLSGLFEMASRREFRPRDTGFELTTHIETNIERAQAHNVAGMLRGSDPELAEQWVVFTAHHDHLGVNPNDDGDDKILNGALDNALGVAAITAAAEAFTLAHPRRSMMFVTVTAEEGGILGSGAFVENPPVPQNLIVANFNVDSPQVFGLTSDVAAIGLEMNSIGEIFRAVAQERGLTPKGDPNPNAGSFYRSDQVSFAKLGIPALYLQRGTDYVAPLSFDPTEYRQQHYHQVSDEIRPEWDLSGTVRDMQVLFETALRVANADDQPRWVPGHEFEEEWRSLYGRED